MAWLERAELVPPEAAATIRANCFPGGLDRLLLKPGHLGNGFALLFLLTGATRWGQTRYVNLSP